MNGRYVTTGELGEIMGAMFGAMSILESKVDSLIELMLAREIITDEELGAWVDVSMERAANQMKERLELEKEEVMGSTGLGNAPGSEKDSQGDES